ncbi:aldo/keto reductase [Nocardia fusca]|uniref:aldo/keto reductase n=1 Tax=Nocardia fusca TaxID=941183 RepID=UPI0037C72712
MKQTLLGDGLTVSAQGLGAMGMSAFYGTTDETEAIATLRHALDLGVNLIDTAEAYGPFANEKLIARALGDRRGEAILATKFGTEFDDDGNATASTAAPSTRAARHIGRYGI